MTCHDGVFNVQKLLSDAYLLLATDHNGGQIIPYSAGTDFNQSAGVIFLLYGQRVNEDINGIGRKIQLRPKYA